MTTPINFIRLACILACLVASYFLPVHAKKIYTSSYGRVYMHSGDSIIADGKLRISVPIKNKKIKVISNAYTKKNEVERQIAPEEVDSVIIWASTSPQRPHTFRYIKNYGWCWQLEKTPYISVLCYAPKGYYCAGNGGIWTYGKSKMLIIKGEEIYTFGKPDKIVDNKIRSKLEAIFADDVRCVEYFRTAHGRLDKVLRGIAMYNPK